MNRPPLHNSALCRTRVHCGNCRTLAAARAAILETHYLANATADGFDCPEGFDADNLPDRPAESPPYNVPPFAAVRLAICAKCPEADCPVVRASNCRRAAVLSRPRFHCPTGRF